MAFPLDDRFLGPPDYGPRKGTVGVVFHTTEGAGTSRAAAVATAQWQKDTGASSYNFIVYDGGVLLTVPERNSSGSLTLKRDPSIWAPDRFPWIREMFGEAAYSDPNAYVVAISLSGKTASFIANGYPPSMVDICARIVRWVEQQSWGNDNLVLTNHFQWQLNRSDPGPGLIPLVLKRYGELSNPPAWPAPLATYDPARVVSFAAGQHTGYKFDLSGAVVGSRGYTLAAPSSARTNEKRLIPAQSGNWFHIVDGVWAGFYVREGNGVVLGAEPVTAPTAEQLLVLCQADFASAQHQLAEKNAQIVALESAVASASTRVTNLEGAIRNYLTAVDVLRKEVAQ